MQQSKNPFSQSPLPGAGGMSCEQARRQIERMIEDCDLKEVERTMLLAHVRACPGCKAELESCRRLEVRMKDAFAPLDTGVDFTERLMAALPAPESNDAPAWLKDVRAAGGGAADFDYRPLGRSTGAPRRESGTSSGVLRLLKWRRAYALPLAILALVLIGGLGAYWRFNTHSAPQDAAPLVAEISGTALRIHGGGPELPLKVDDPIRESDVILSGAQPVRLTLTSGRVPIGQLLLAPNSRLGALNRHAYKVLGGAVYFDVFKDRPGAGDEVFEVDANGLARVRVTGTQFCVDLGAQPFGAVVVVKEGTVLVQPCNSPTPFTVTSGQEQIVSANGALARQKSDLKARLAWMNGNSRGPFHPAGIARHPANEPAPGALVPPAPPIPAIDWKTPLKGSLPCAGKTLREGLDMLSESQGRPAELQELIVDYAPLKSEKLSFSIYLSPVPADSMPLQSALMWMARDMGMLFSGGRFVYPRNNDAPETESGNLPEGVYRALETRHAEKFAPGIKLDAVLDSFSRACNVTIIAEGAQAGRFEELSRSPGFTLSGDTVLERIDSLLRALDLNAAWYDHALYLAPPSQIEQMTKVERTLPLPAALTHPREKEGGGAPNAPNKEWEHQLRLLLPALIAYPADKSSLQSRASRLSLNSDAVLQEQPVIASNDVRIQAGLKYTTGMLGDALVAAALSRLENPPPEFSSPAIALTRNAPNTPLENLDPLLKDARSLLTVREIVKCPSFGRSALVLKELPLGEALEWAAWLGQCGIRQENNALVVDTLEACYGRPQLQVLALDEIVAKAGGRAEDVQREFGRLLPELFPTFFDKESATLYYLSGRIVFKGDRRQLELALRVRRDLKQELDHGPVKISEWQPKWRARLEEALDAPCKDLPKLEGSFASVLRNPLLSSRIRCTVMVDPAAMKDVASKDVGEIDPAGLKAGEVLERLANAAGLKMTKEGNVVWMHRR